MADPYSTGALYPTKTLSCDDGYTLYPDYLYSVREPERPPYGRTVSESARRLARNVRLLRVAHGWSQEALALNAGLDRTFVGAIERAERNITLASAEKIAKAFGMTVADLLTPCDIHQR